MRRLNLVRLVLVSAGAAAGATEAAGQHVKGRLFSQLGAYEAGDMPTLYLQFENGSSETVTELYATAEEMHAFPSDLLWVYKDGAKLPYLHSPESHPRAQARSAIHAGGTLTLEVPLDQVCVLPADTVGRYRVELMADYYSRHVSMGPIEFEIRAVRGGGSLMDVLHSSGWKQALSGAQAGRRGELEDLSRRADVEPGLRARAARTIFQGGVEPAFLAIWSELALDPNPIVAMAALSDLRGKPAEAQLPILVGALQHRDVSVRRLAAKHLAGIALTDELVRRVAVAAASTEDEVVRGYLASTQPSRGQSGTRVP